MQYFLGALDTSMYHAFLEITSRGGREFFLVVLALYSRDWSSFRHLPNPAFPYSLPNPSPALSALEGIVFDGS